MNFKHKIAIVICWYGPWPWYFKLFVHTVKFNPSVDFYFITDTKIEIELPDNIKIIVKSLCEIELLASQKLGFNVDMKTAYKLCDFKPVYGLLFEEYIKDYDFWGHGDCDIVFGNIRHFITDEILTDFDVIAVRHDFLTGYFTLFRNIPKINNLFKFSKDYEKVLSSSKHYCFDETNFCFVQFTDNLHYSKIHGEIESMTHVVKKMQEIKYINAYFEFLVVEGAQGKLKWNDGILIYNHKYEVLLYHLILFKMNFKPVSEIETIPLSFSIGRDSITY